MTATTPMPKSRSSRKPRKRKVAEVETVEVKRRGRPRWKAEELKVSTNGYRFTILFSKTEEDALRAYQEQQGLPSLSAVVRKQLHKVVKEIQEQV